jgi:hypothetical protein
MRAPRPIAAVLATLAFATLATAASAAERTGPASGFYGGVTVRQEGLEQGLAFGNVSSSFGRFAALETEAAASTSAFGGYRFRNDLALEASVASTSGYRLAGRGGVGLMLPPGAEADARQLNVDVVGSWSFWRSLSLYGRLGYAQSEIAPVYRTSLATPERRTGDGLEYGVGLRYDFSKALGLKLEYARVGSAAEVDRGMMPDVDRLQFGVQYRF